MRVTFKKAPALLPLPLGGGSPAALPQLTQHRQEGSTDDGGDAAATQDSLALVVAGVAARGAGDGQPAVVVAEAARQRHPIFLPNDVQLDQGPGGREGNRFSATGTSRGGQAWVGVQAQNPSPCLFEGRHSGPRFSCLQNGTAVPRGCAEGGRSNAGRQLQPRPALTWCTGLPRTVAA